MSLTDKIKNLFLEDDEDHPNFIQVRAAHASGPKPVKKEDSNPEKKVRKWVKSTSATAPWAALAIILFGVFAHGAVAASALGYGLMKVAIAVVGAVIADETMFRGLKESKDSNWLPMIRRALVFIGICWLMAVT